VKEPAEKIIQTIRRASRKRYSAEEKIRIVLEGLRGEDSFTRRVPHDHAPSVVPNPLEALAKSGESDSEAGYSRRIRQPQRERDRA